MKIELNRTHKLIILLAASPVILLFSISILITIINAAFGNSDCPHEKAVRELQLSGLITEKYRKRGAHNAPVIKLLTQEGEKEYILDIWNEVNVGDSLLKEAGSTTFLKKRGETSTKINLNFDCKEGDFFLQPF